MNLEQYQCRECGKFFYVNRLDRNEYDIDFGCPFGCDDNGRHVRNIETEIRRVDDMTQEIKEHKI